MEGVWLVMVWWLVIILSTACGGSQSYGDPQGNVTYDERSLIINGQHRILFSGSIHYPRSTPQMWRSLVAKAKKGGLDVIQTYVFWNLHEPQPGKFDFSGRQDIVKFIKEIQAQGLYVCLRIGPFIESEWSYGALPFWLHNVPGIVFRSDNEPFKFYMKKFATKIVNMMKSERLYASQGGPIILSQIENEYKMVEAAFGEKGPAYVRWAARMAANLQTGVPWVMCKQDDAPDPVINACNGRRCGETFAGPNSPNKPSIWTENWTSFYQTYGEEEVMRSVEDIAFQVALFIAKKGSYVNYYMYHGGTNFGRTASAYVTPRYYDQAPLDEYGFVRQPMWGHLKELHAAIKLCMNPLIAGKYRNISIGELQQAHVFRKSSELCVAFLANNDTSSMATVLFGDLWYKLPPKSISILPDCRTVVFNTAKVNTEYGTRGVTHSQQLNLVDNWEEYKEATLEFDKTVLRANELLEQLSTTNDISDYLWYTFRFEQNALDPHEYELSVESFGHVLHAFVNGAFAGFAHGTHKNKSFTLHTHVSLNTGANHVSILSGMVGLPDSGAFLERRFAGLRRVHVKSRHEFLDFTNHTWGYQVGLMGEKLEVYSKHGLGKVQWKEFRASADKRLTWYKTYFDKPPGKDPVTLNLHSMGKGEAWVNGESIGRYWVSFHTPSGSPSQERYSIPRSFLQSKDNLLVLFEEENGNPLRISIDTISIKRVCGHVSDSHPLVMASWVGHNHTGITHDKAHGRRPKVQLSCPPRKKISKIIFASFGTPSGDCENYGIGVCHSDNSRHIVTKACLGKKMCSVPVTSQNFGHDPCPGTSKSLLVVAECH